MGNSRSTCCGKWSSCPGCVLGGISNNTYGAYEPSGTFGLLRQDIWGSREGWIPITSVTSGLTNSKSVLECPQSTVSSSLSWCYDNCGHRGCFLFSGLRTSQAVRVPSPHGYGQITQVRCTHVVGDGPHVLDVFWVGPASLRVEHLDC